MRSSSRRLLVALFALGLVAAGAGTAAAAETAASELVIIRDGDRISEDLYAVGTRVIVEGVVDGDLIAFAAEDVTITGTVTGDLVAVAPLVEITGEVSGAARVLGGELRLSGEIGEDLVDSTWRAALDSGSVVGGDALIWAVELEAAGRVGGDLEGTQRTTRLQGEVDGRVEVTVTSLTVTGPLEVGDDLGYRSKRAAEGLGEATVGGVVVHKTALPPNIRVRALALLVRLLVVIALTATALLVAWGWPQRTVVAADLARARTLRCAGYGAVVMLSPLILVLVAWLVAALAPASASFPFLVAFLPVVLAASGMVLVLSLVAGVPSALALGRLVSGRLHLYGAMLVGSALAGLIWMIPWIGWLVPAAFLSVGLGAWMLALRAGVDDGEPAHLAG